MPRAIWTGHISFGLVNVPVKLYSAEQRSDISLHLLDKRNNARVKYERVNADTGEAVQWDDIVHGYEYSDGNYVVLSEEELKRAAPEVTKQVEIDSFVSVHDVNFMYFDKPYYLEPGKGGEKGYALLRRALRDAERIGIARVVIRTRQYIAALAPMGDVLVLNLLRYAHELRGTKDLNIPEETGKAAPHADELRVAKMLIDAMTTEWKPEKYKDEYHDELIKWIEKRIESGDTKHPAKVEEPEPDDTPPTLNFMELLKKSLADKGGPSKPVPRPANDETEEAPARRARAKAPARTKAPRPRKRAG